MPCFSPRTQCWLEGSHPDVNGKQLALLCSRLGQMERGQGLLKLCRKYGFRDMGVFWDWASLFQKDPSLFEASEAGGGAAYEASRSTEEKALIESEGRVEREEDAAPPGRRTFLRRSLGDGRDCPPVGAARV